MSKLYIPTSGPQSWQALLADPVKHWRTGYSARTLAHCWEAAQGLPPEIAELFGRDTELLIAISKSRAATSQCAMNVSIASSLEQISTAGSRAYRRSSGGDAGLHILCRDLWRTPQLELFF